MIRPAARLFDSGMMVAQNAKNVMEPQVQLRQFFIKNTFHIFCERCFALVANLANYTLKPNKSQ